MLFNLFLDLLECNSSLSQLVLLQYFLEGTMCILPETLRGVSYYSQSLKQIPSLFSVEHLVLCISGIFIVKGTKTYTDIFCTNSLILWCVVACVVRLFFLDVGRLTLCSKV